MQTYVRHDSNQFGQGELTEPLDIEVEAYIDGNIDDPVKFEITGIFYYGTGVEIDPKLVTAEEMALIEKSIERHLKHYQTELEEDWHDRMSLRAESWEDR